MRRVEEYWVIKSGDHYLQCIMSKDYDLPGTELPRVDDVEYFVWDAEMKRAMHFAMNKGRYRSDNAGQVLELIANYHTYQHTPMPDVRIVTIRTTTEEID